MGKRKIKSNSLAVLVALLALFLSAGIAAAAPQPNEGTCKLLNSSGQETSYTVTPQSPYGVDGNWNYRTSFNGTQFAVLLPVCDHFSYRDSTGTMINYTGNNYSAAPNNTTVIYTTNPFSPTSLSSNWNGFGVWDSFDQLLTITSLSGTSGFGFVTTTAVPIPFRATSMQFKLGKDYLYCPNIAGPGCAVAPPPRAQSVVSSMTAYSGIDAITGLEYSYCTKTDPITQCEVVFTDCTPEGEEMVLIPLTDLSFAGGQLLDFSIPGQGCPTVVLQDNFEGASRYVCTKLGCYYIP